MLIVHSILSILFLFGQRMPGTELAPLGERSQDRQASIAPYFTLVEVAGGFNQPLFLTNAADASGRLFVLERRGLIKLIKDGSVVSTPFLDIRSRVGSDSNEQGLLGLAFHPGYTSNGRVFIYYTDEDGAITISEFALSSNPDQLDAGSEQILIKVSKTRTNHNGGTLAFGPDGYLYIGTGDGGGGGDPDDNAQDLSSLFGKLLRIDIDSGSPYSIPPDNPFAGSADPDVRQEIWAFGLRNPWKFSFDRTTGDLYIGDVGQGRREEVDYQPSSSPGGENYGWRIMEGSICYNPSTNCDETGKVLPVAEYGHNSDGGCSITGGYAYRGSANPDLDGVYLFADFCNGKIWALEQAGSAWSMTLIVDSPYVISSFGEDEQGEVYVVDYGSGKIFRVVMQRFIDVTPSHWAFGYINELYDEGYVAGCSSNPRQYCPDNILSRAESAVFVLRGEYGAIPDPPHPAPSVPTFADVDAGFWGFGWIESLWQDGFTAGCSTNPLMYCTDTEHTRAEGSVFFLRVKKGVDYEPPAPSGIFSDVNLGEWYAGWVEAAYNEGILPACSTNPLQFCPEDKLDRAWAAYMMIQAKGGLPLP